MSGTRRRTRALARAALALTVAAVPLTGTGVAAADPTGVVPILECVARERSGGYTAVLGYDNRSAATVTLPYGRSNRITPSRYDGGQPTTFAPGRQRGVFSLVVENGAPVLRWKLDGTTVVLSPSGGDCPPPTEMPANGNGTGVAVGLGAAGLVGVLLARRVQRRAAAAGVPSHATAQLRPEADDA